jgi:hypothetical protein
MAETPYGPLGSRTPTTKGLEAVEGTLVLLSEVFVQRLALLLLGPLLGFPLGSTFDLALPYPFEAFLESLFLLLVFLFEPSLDLLDVRCCH